MSTTLTTNTLDITKRYTIPLQGEESGDCSLYFVKEVGKYCNQYAGWFFYCGFNPNHNSQDMNWDDLPKWMQIAFLNSPELIIKDNNPED